MQKFLYIDMDNVLVDFRSGMERLPNEILEKYPDDPDEIPGIFSLMGPMLGAIEAFHKLATHFDTYILSTSPWKISSAWSDMLTWVKMHLGSPEYKRLILTHHKNLNMGDYLVDDRT
jgi:5'(3')-deoxyribonucleotidase